MSTTKHFVHKGFNSIKHIYLIFLSLNFGSAISQNGHLNKNRVALNLKIHCKMYVVFIKVKSTQWSF